MEKKITLGISLGLLFIAFGLVSFLVILTKRHPYFVAKKLRLGALIISLSSVAIGCGTTTCYSPVATCYDSISENMFTIDQTDSRTQSIILRLAISDTITGNILERHGNTFSYAITDSLNSIVLKENIAPSDGTYDANEEGFKIVVGKTILPGTYELRLFTVPKDSIKNVDWYRQTFPLIITE
jgi:hypothetical protein